MVNCIAWRVRPRLVFGVMAGLMAAAFAVYCATLCLGVFPGESARTVSALSGFDGFDTMPKHSLFYACAWGIWKLFPASYPLALNLFSAVCSTLAAGLFYFFMVQWLLMCSREDVVNDVIFDEESGDYVPNENAGVIRHNQSSVVAAVVGAATAAFVFATAIPMWSMATRLHVEPFDAVLVLLILNYTLSAIEVLNRRDVMAAVFLCGLTCLESAWFVVVSPLALFFLGRIVFQARQNDDEHPRFRYILGAAISGVVCALAGLLVMNACMPQWPVQALPRLLLGQWLSEVEWWIPRGYWLAMLLQTILPASLVLIFSFSFFRARNWWSFLFQLALLTSAVPSLFNLACSAGYRMRLTGASVGVDATSMLDSAVPATVIGILVASWLLLRDPISYRTFDEPDYEGQTDHKSLAKLGGVLALAVVVMAGVSIVWRFPAANGRAGQFADTAAAVCLRQMADESVVYGATPLRHNLYCLAQRQGKAIRFMPAAGVSELSFARRRAAVAKLLPSVEDIYAVSLGVSPCYFVNDWLMNEPAAAGKIAAFSPCALLERTGMWAYPRGLFEAVAPSNQVALVESIALSERMTQEVMTALEEASTDGSAYLTALQGKLQTAMGRVANDAAVLCVRQKMVEPAIKGFRKALELDAGNAAAALNLYAVGLREGSDLPDAAVLGAQAKAAVEHAGGERRAFDSLYGQVADTGVWLAFQSGLAAPRLEEVVQAVQADLLKRAAECLSMENYAGAEALARELLSEFLERSPKALLCLAVALAGQGKTFEAQRCLDEIRKQGFKDENFTGVLALIDLKAGRPQDARERLKKAFVADQELAVIASLRKRPKLLQVLDAKTEELQVLALMAQVLFELGLAPEVEASIVKAMWTLTERSGHPLVYRVQGHVLYSKNPPEYEAARALYMQALALMPEDTALRDRILQIDYRLQNMVQSEADAEAALRADPYSSMGNFLLGHIYRMRGKLDLAKILLHRSLAERPTVLAHIELAELFYDESNWEAAEKQIVLALRLDEKSDRGWAILARALMRKGKLKEAQQAAERAIQMSPQEPLFQLTLAHILIRLGDREGAAKLVVPMLPRRDREPRPIREEIDSVMRELE